MVLYINQFVADNGAIAADLIAQRLNWAIAGNGQARLLLSTGESQFEMFGALVEREVDWSAVTVFHLDEYIGLPKTHPASFRKYLTDRFVSRLPVPLRAMNYINADAGDLFAVIASLTKLLGEAPIDVGVIGIGVNGHIAFNDPPSDFETDDAYKIVTLDDTCRRQQVGEGWFPDLNSVPEQAVSMTVRQILSCKCVISVVPHAVKAEAVKNTLTVPLSPNVPATALKSHPDWHLFVDYAAASKIFTP